jgi:uncharacterized protein YxeA
MKKIVFTVIAVLGLIFVLGMLFIFKTKQNYNDPAYQEYKDKYFRCVDTGSTLTPDVKIYQAYKDNQPINCD